MTKTTTNDLVTKLRREFPKKAAKAKRTTDERSRTSPVTNGGAQRLSITLYPTDLERLDEIKHVMLAERVRNLSDSETLRLAVRTSATDGTLLRKVYDAMILEDRRRI